MREENQLKIICRILENYQLDQSLSRYLKDFYKTHPQMGSRDRRLASAFVYNYFRIGRSLQDVRMIERLTIANFLCAEGNHALLSYCLDKFTLLSESEIESSLNEKIKKVGKLYSSFNPEKIFPFAGLLSEQIDKEKFIESFLHQPKLWIRIRKGFFDSVCNEFSERGISYASDDKNSLTLSLANATSLEKTNSFLNGYFEIQDWSSQQTISFIHPEAGDTWWDACSGSGGKSLMMFDAEPALKILATDQRASILKNLYERFKKTDIKNFKAIQIDLTEKEPIPVSINNFLDEPFHILADVPCTGSGTWGRTPEWLSRFDTRSISQFVSSQRKIIQKLALTLQIGQKLVYVTCSVFKEENEENVDWIIENIGFKLKTSSYINGFSKGADTMYVAVFVNE